MDPPGRFPNAADLRGPLQDLQRLHGRYCQREQWGFCAHPYVCVWLHTRRKGMLRGVAIASGSSRLCGCWRISALSGIEHQPTKSNALVSNPRASLITVWPVWLAFACGTLASRLSAFTLSLFSAFAGLVSGHHVAISCPVRVKLRGNLAPPRFEPPPFQLYCDPRRESS